MRKLNILFIALGMALLLGVAGAAVVKKPISVIPIEPQPVAPKSSVSNILIRNVVVNPAVAGNYTRLGFQVFNNNSERLSGVIVKVQPGDGIAEITYNLPGMNPNASASFNPSITYLTPGIKQCNIIVIWNSTNYTYPVSIAVRAPQYFTVSGMIIGGQLGNGTDADISFGLYNASAGSDGSYSIQVQNGTNYFVVRKEGNYKWSQLLTVNSGAQKNVTMVPYFETRVLGEDGMYFMKFMTNTFNPSTKGNPAIADDVSYAQYVKPTSTSADERLSPVKTSGILTRWKDLPIQIYYNRSGAPSGYIANLTRALANWTAAAGKAPGTMFNESPTPIPLSAKGINFFYPTECPNGGFGETFPVNSSAQGDITNVNICIRTNVGASAYKYYAHELGHGLTLWSHSEDLTHLMKAGAGRDITTDEATMIRNLYNIPSLTNMDNYKIEYVHTYLRNILIYSASNATNETLYNFTDRFYSPHYTDMVVCRDINCTNCNQFNKTNCVCYAENIAPSPAVGTFVIATCQYPKNSTDSLYTKVCDRDSTICSKMCNLQALNC